MPNPPENPKSTLHVVVKALPHGPDAWTDQKVIFCNHEGFFIADVIVSQDAVAIIAPKPVTPDKLHRPKDLSVAEWRISDDAGGYWNPAKGRFLLPRESVCRLGRAQ